MTDLLKERNRFTPEIPKILEDLSNLSFAKGEPTASVANQVEIQKQFPHTYGANRIHLEKGAGKSSEKMKVGVVLSGGQAAGGHNVIAGLFDALKQLHSESELIGFLNGPGGIIEGKFNQITEEGLSSYRNTGGFDLIGSGRTKIETEEQFEKSLQVVKKLSLDGLVIIGGDDSNTNAALLAEYFLAKGIKTKVVGVPKTIDGDLKNEDVEVSFGFDTACKTYSEMIGNIARDAISARKYYHFIKLMGRSASHIALECALQIHPNLTLIGEEVKEKKLTLQQIVQMIVELVKTRAEQGKNFGLILVPEGLIEFIPEMGELIQNINQLLADGKEIQLSGHFKEVFDLLPKEIQNQLLLDRDPHGNVQVSKIATEKLLLELVSKEVKIKAVEHFFGYEGRSGFPSNFDSNYCYSLGMTAALILREGLTGYMCAVKHLTKHPSEWKIAGIPITSLFHLEERKGKLKPVIQKALVELSKKPFQEFAKMREEWKMQDAFRFPGPIQFFGPPALCNDVPITLELEQ